MNDIKLQSPEGKHPVDENLRPILIGGKSSSLELSQNGDGARVTGGLEVSGTGKSIVAEPLITNTIFSTDLNIHDAGDITLNADDDIILDANTTNVIFKDSGTEGGRISIDTLGSGDGDRNLTLKTGTAQGNYLILDAAASLNSALQLESASGNFIMSKDGTEFSATKSSYAGMILGYTEMAYGTTSGRYDTTTSFVVINDNYDHGDGAEDHFLGVTFVVPPSNRVEIEVFLPYTTGADGTLHLGLATATDATTLKSKFEVVVWDVDETDLVQIVQRWVIDGSDVGLQGGAWSAGESKTLYCMAKEGTAGGRLFWGDAFVNYGDMTMKATALPTTIGDGT